MAKTAKVPQHWAKTRIVMVRDGNLPKRDGGGPRMVQRYEWKCTCGKTSNGCTYPTKASAMKAGVAHARTQTRPPVDDDVRTWRPKKRQAVEDLATSA